MIESSSDSRTLTAGAGASTCLSVASPFDSLDSGSLGVPVVASCKATNTNSLLGANVSVSLEVRRMASGSGSWGSWAAEKTVALELGIATAGAASKSLSVSHFVDNSGGGDEKIDVRLVASCTGQNVALDSEWQIWDPQPKR